MLPTAPTWHNPAAAVADVAGPLCCCCCCSSTLTPSLSSSSRETRLKPGAVYPEAVAYGAQKLWFGVCSGIIGRDACPDAGVILKISLFLWSAYSNAAFQALQRLPFCRR